MTEQPTFHPDWVSPPGDTIEDALEELGMTQAEFASRTGFTRKHVNDMVKGKVAITADTAVKLEAVLGEPASFWLRREAQYQEALARRAELDRAEAHKDWLKQLPLSEMIKFDWVKAFTHKGQQVLSVLRFFGVASVDAWNDYVDRMAPAFRASNAFAKNRGAVAAWLRKAELDAQSFQLRPFDRRALEDALLELRKLTIEARPSVFRPKMQKICADCGVAVVFVPAPKGCPASGATWWATPDRAVVVLSLRHKTNDHFWFSFFHELGHLLKHGKKLRFIEGINGLDAEKERQADDFAQMLLIPQTEELRLLAAQRPISHKAIHAFAAKHGIAPGIVVGRLQHDKLLPPSHLNRLKITYRWSHEQ